MNDVTKFDRIDALCTVQAMFPNNSVRYSYFIPEGDQPMPGDVLVTSATVDTIDDIIAEGGDLSGLRAREIVTNAKLATVVQVELHANPKATKFYLQLIPVQALRDRQVRNRVLVSKARERATARAALDKMLAQADRMQEYRRLADKDPEAKRMLDILEGRG